MNVLLQRIKDFFASASPENAYALEGAVPLRKALLIGLQHLLAMFVSNMAPVLLVFVLIGQSTTVDPSVTNNALRTAIFMAGIGTMIQCFPIFGKVGSKLPVIAGSSFTFLGALVLVGVQYGLGTMFVSLIVGGIAITVLALFAHKWYRFIKPVVSALVVLALGLSLLSVGARDFIGLDEPGVLANAYYDWGVAWPYLVVASFTLLVSVLWQIFVKGPRQSVHILVALVAGFALACCFIPYNKMVDFSAFRFESVTDFIDVPRPFFTLKGMELSWGSFNVGAILVVFLLYLVTCTEVIGTLSSLTSSTLNREPTKEEIRGGILAMGVTGTFSGFFGGVPFTLYAQNVGISAQTKIVNRFSTFTCGTMLVLVSLLTPFATLLSCIPRCVLAGTLVSLFGSIVVIGVQMLSKAGFSKKNILVASISLCIGYGVTLLTGFTSSAGAYDVQALNYLMVILSNPVANVFILALLLSYIVPDTFGDPPKEKKRKN